jgi:hypothetical protein
MQEMKRLDIDSSKIWDPYQPMPTAMTKPRPWALSREQVELVQHGTKGLRPEWRDDFVDAVVDELMPLDTITDTDVNGAVAVVLLRIMMAA